MKKAVIIVAGGTGTRMGSAIPKQFLLLHDTPILIHTLRCFFTFDAELTVILVLHSSCFEMWEDIKNQYLNPIEKEKIFVVTGGVERTTSVFNGLSLLAKEKDATEKYVVAIHDAVRPFVSQKILSNTFQMAEKIGAAIPVVPVKSSLRKKYIGEESNSFESSSPVNRNEYVEVQTPQVFDFESIFVAYQHRKHELYTDDASLYEAETGKQVADVAGDYDNIKITSPEDIYVGEKILNRDKKQNLVMQ